MTERAPLPPNTKHVLPALPYEYSALEPTIDTRTMRLHHDGHHATYVTQLNAALTDYPELQRRSLEWLLLNPAQLPGKIRTVVRRNAGGHLNHSLFWSAMAPAGGDAPSGALADAIVRDFGSVANLEERFAVVGEQHFGSGWVWLVRTGAVGGKLKVISTPEHVNPLQRGKCTVLVNDVWEHAYYLKYENRRADYLKDWWTVVNWKEAARRYVSADRSAEESWEGEGGQVAAAG